jgi:hypothetical protein
VPEDAIVVLLRAIREQAAGTINWIAGLIVAHHPHCAPIQRKRSQKMHKQRHASLGIRRHHAELWADIATRSRSAGLHAAAPTISIEAAR